MTDPIHVASTADGAVALPRRVLIANRGEIVARVARTCRAMGIDTVAVYSDADVDAVHVHACDLAVHLSGVTPAQTYLRADALIEAAERTGADAVHPGFGFLAEAPDFARAVGDAGLTWIGPDPRTIAAMGDKLEARARMADAGVPLAPGARLADDADPAAILAATDELGLPLLVKATGGGGGKGIRAVHDRDEVVEAVAAARREAGAAFGDERVFLERLIERPRHVEVQVLGDTHGHVVHLHERECSIQRRHQKIVEESPSPGIDAAVRAAMGDAAVAAAQAVGYVNAGTVEFVADESRLARRRAGEDLDPTSCFAFLEVNTRLQVEHPVTEEVVAVRDDATGTLEPIDLVRWQLLIAAGVALPASQDRIVARGHSIEVRLYAEDVPAGYLPATGRLTAFDVPDRPGIRKELGVRAGEAVTPHYDPMLAKLIATAPTRDEAASRLATALAASPIVGVTTNRDLLVAILRDDRFLAGATTTAFLADHLDDLLARVRPAPREQARAALFAAVHLTVRGAGVRGPGALASLPPGFGNTGAVWDQHTFLPAGLLAVTGTGDGRREVATAGSRGQRGPVASVDDPAEVVAQGALTVRLRTRRDGSYDGEVLTGVPAAFLDVDGEVVHAVRLTVHGHGPDHLDVEVEGQRQRITVAGSERSAGDAAVRGAGGSGGAPARGVSTGMDGRRVQVLAPGLGIVDLDVVPRFPDRTAAALPGATRAPMPGVVVAVAVGEGEPVEEGAVLVTVEAMKMEHRVTAPRAGTVAEVRVVAGQQVDTDEVLVVVDDRSQDTAD